MDGLELFNPPHNKDLHDETDRISEPDNSCRPDDDARIGKRHLVVRLGADRGWLLYSLLCLTVTTLIAAAWYRHPGLLLAIAAVAVLAGGGVTAALLRCHVGNKAALRRASQTTVALQGLVALLLLLDGWLGALP